MDKSLLEYMSEEDEEYNITIKSVKDIGRISGLLRLALIRYDLRELGEITHSPTAESDVFPDCGPCRVYSVDAKIGRCPRSGVDDVVRNLSVELNIPERQLYVEADFPEADDAEDVDSEEDPLLLRDIVKDETQDDNQKLVGQRRVTDYMDEFARKRDARDEMKKKKMSRVLATHKAVKDILGESVPKGYYRCSIDEVGKLIVEQACERSDRYSVITGKESYEKHLKRLFA